MEFETQAVVHTEDGMEVGRIGRLVLNPKSQEMTHLVLKKGVLPEDTVVPVGLVSAGTEEGVTLRGQEEDLESLPPFEEKHYIEADPSGAGAQPMTFYPAAGLGQPVVLPEPSTPAERRLVVEVTRNIPDGTVAMKGGATVVAADGRKVGRVEKLLTDTETDRVTDLVIAQGFLGRTRRRIPMCWVHHVGEAAVDLWVESEAVDGARVVAR